MKNNNNGIGFFSVLGIVFIVLKLVGVINWSWWIVLLPFWGFFVIYIIFAIVVWLALR